MQYRLDVSVTFYLEQRIRGWKSSLEEGWFGIRDRDFSDLQQRAYVII